MPFPSVSYTFVNGTRVIANNINTNFSDFISGITDGSKNINVARIGASDITSVYTNVKGKTTPNTTTISGDTSFSSIVEAEGNTKFKKFSLSPTQELITLDVTGDIAPSNSNIALKAVSYNKADFSSITIGSSNNKLQISESGESVKTVTITNGGYNGTTLATQMQTDMNAALTQTYAVVYSGGKFTISCGAAFILWSTGGKDIVRTILPTIGFVLGNNGTGTQERLMEWEGHKDYQVGYYRALDGIDGSNLEDGSILCIKLMSSVDGGNFAPVSVYLSMFYTSPPIVEIAIMKDSVLYVQVKKDETSAKSLTLLNYSDNFHPTYYY